MGLGLGFGFGFGFGLDEVPPEQLAVLLRCPLVLLELERHVHRRDERLHPPAQLVARREVPARLVEPRVRLALRVRVSVRSGSRAPGEGHGFGMVRVGGRAV